jgi:hypothetical protein
VCFCMIFCSDWCSRLYSKRVHVIAIEAAVEGDHGDEALEHDVLAAVRRQSQIEKARVCVRQHLVHIATVGPHRGCHRLDQQSNTQANELAVRGRQPTLTPRELDELQPLLL